MPGTIVERTNEQVTALRAARLEQGWSIKELVRQLWAEAERQDVRIGTHPSSVKSLVISWELGRRTPRPVYVKLLTALYETTTEALELPEPRAFSMDNPQLADLFATYRGFVWGYLYRRVGRDFHLAEDLMMETFIKVGEALSGAPGGSVELDSAHKFLALQARWVLSDYYRASLTFSKRERLLSANDEGGLPDFPATDALSCPEDSVIGTLSILDLAAGLSERERELIVLRFFDGLSVAELAQRMDVSVTHTRRMLNTALATMRNNAVVVWELPNPVRALERAA